MLLIERRRVDLNDKRDDNVENDHDHDHVENAKVEPRPPVPVQLTVHVGCLAPVVAHQNREERQKSRVGVIEVEQVVERVARIVLDHCLVLLSHQTIEAQPADRVEKDQEKEK